MRVLITGSREWQDFLPIQRALLRVTNGHAGPWPITLVSGHCPTGADAIGEHLAKQLGWSVEAYPARWDLHGKAAGPIRNQQMVDTGPDICLAFPRGRSAGTRDCMRRAAAHGIPVLSHEWEER